jgi:hypothetical protein
MDLYFLNKARRRRSGTIAGAGKRPRAHRVRRPGRTLPGRTLPADPVAMPGHESGGSVGRAHGLADVVGEIPVKAASNPAKFCSSPRRAGAKIAFVQISLCISII